MKQFELLEITHHSADGALRIVAMPTECPQLVITPSVEHRVEDPSTPRLAGGLTLTHLGTGAAVAHSGGAGQLEKLAAQLKDFNWDFTDRQYFTRPENAETLQAVSTVVREWQMGDAYGCPVSLWGDDEEKKAERDRDPAGTLLREQLDWWPKHYKAIHDRDLINTNKDAWHAEISCSVNGFGMAYLLAVLMRIDPKVADIAGRRLTAEFDAGDQLGEWVYQWTEELAAGKPLTLYGIPDAVPLAGFGADQ